MAYTITGIFILLHGLVHLWYFTLSRGLVEFKPDMGWTGKSWLLTPMLGDETTRTLAGIFYVLATFLFVISSIGIFSRGAWNTQALWIASIFSSAVILICWDGHTQMAVQKGVVGLAINMAIINP